MSVINEISSSGESRKFTDFSSLGILGFASGTLFSFVTLPVEFDASNRAVYWLERKRIVNQRELVASKDALKWAAMTYVVAALGSLAQLVYFWTRMRR